MDKLEFKTKAGNYRGTYKSKAHKNIYMARIQGEKLNKQSNDNSSGYMEENASMVSSQIKSDRTTKK